MGVIATLLLITAIAGVVGTGLGGLIGAVLQKNSDRVVSPLLSFAGGVMLSMVCFELIPEALETQVGSWVVIGAVAVSMIVINALEYLIDRKADHHGHSHTQAPRKGDSKLSLFVAGMVMACAIALHNVPEGMTIGAAYAGSHGTMGKAALTLAVLIGMHNIPAGMAISVPLISGGMEKTKAVLLTALTGTPTMIGALLGYLLGDMGAVGLALSLGFASGAMLYVVFGEILPQSFRMYNGKLPAVSAIVGILAGMVIIFA